MSDSNKIPRWAVELGEETWGEILDRLGRGWDVMDIVRDLELPREKTRSLQEFARKFGPKRRLIRYAEFKDALIKGAADWGPQFSKAMGLLAEQAVNPKVKDSTQKKAVLLMVEMTKALRRMMADEQIIESAKEAEKKPLASGDVSQMIANLLKSYNKHDEAAAVLAKAEEAKKDAN